LDSEIAETKVLIERSPVILYARDRFIR